MRIVSWNWFWYVLLGFIMGGGAVYLYTLLKEKSIKLAWHELTLTALSFATFLFLGQTFIASFNEGEPRAAWLTVVFMGLPIIMMAVIVARSIGSRMTVVDAPKNLDTGKTQPSSVAALGESQS